MNVNAVENAKWLYNKGLLSGRVFFWGIGKNTASIIEKLREEIPELELLGVLDNFKYEFVRECTGLPVLPVKVLEKWDKDEIVILVEVALSYGIRRQCHAMGLKRVYDLNDPDDVYLGSSEIDLHYEFDDRSKGHKTLVYVLAGYQKELWDTSLKRMAVYADRDSIDYCVISSGKYDKDIDEFCVQYGWSYLHSSHNQICYLQNKVIELHPNADIFIKLDEDIFIGKDFYADMIKAYHWLKEVGEYRVGYVVPVIPVGFSGYVSYLDALGIRDEFEKEFGRAYRCVFCAPYGSESAVCWIWDTVKSVDDMADSFRNREMKAIAVGCQINIGAILYSRERWIMMGKWPVNPNQTGMGADEVHIFYENMNNGFATYEMQNIVVGHLAFSGQKEMMMAYYGKYHEKFEIK